MLIIPHAIKDPKLFGPFFRDLDSRRRWLVWIASILALPFGDLERLFGIPARGRVGR